MYEAYDPRHVNLRDVKITIKILISAANERLCHDLRA